MDSPSTFVPPARSQGANVTKSFVFTAAAQQFLTGDCVPFSSGFSGIDPLPGDIVRFEPFAQGWFVVIGWQFVFRSDWELYISCVMDVMRPVGEGSPGAVSGNEDRHSGEGGTPP